MTLRTRSDQEIRESRLNVLDELQTLRKVVPSRKDICLVEEENAALLSKTYLLGLSRDILRTLEVSSPTDGISVSLTLEEGDTLPATDNSGPSMQYHLSEDAAVIPLSSLATLQVKVSGASLNHRPASHGAFLADDGFIYVRYSTVLLMGFSFDESLSDDIANSFLPGGLQQYVNYVVTTSQPNVTMNYQGPTPVLTMRLRTIYLGMVAIGDHCSTLGINIDTEEET